LLTIRKLTIIIFGSILLYFYSVSGGWVYKHSMFNKKQNLKLVIIVNILRNREQFELLNFGGIRNIQKILI